MEKEKEILRLKEIIGILSIKQFALDIGEKPQTISNILAGYNGISTAVAKKIKAKYGYSLDYIYGDTNIKTPATESVVQEPRGEYVPKDKYIAVLEKLTVYQEEEINKSKIRQTALEQ